MSSASGSWLVWTGIRCLCQAAGEFVPRSQQMSGEYEKRGYPVQPLSLNSAHVFNGFHQSGFRYDNQINEYLGNKDQQACCLVCVRAIGKDNRPTTTALPSASARFWYLSVRIRAE